jgi:hypothetical protein
MARSYKRDKNGRFAGGGGGGLKGSAASSGGSSRGESLRGKKPGFVSKERDGNRVKGMTAKNISADVAPLKGHSGNAVGNVSADSRNKWSSPGKSSRFSGASSSRTGNKVTRTGNYYAPSKFKPSNRKKK